MPSAEYVNLLSFYASVATIVGVLLGAVVLVYTARQLLLGRRAAAVGAFIPLNEALRQVWIQFDQAEGEVARTESFADLINLLEVGCAVFHDKLMYGNVGKLLEDYLCAVFRIIQGNEYARDRVEALRDTIAYFGLDESAGFPRAYK